MSGCVKCGQSVTAGQFWVEVRQAGERDGKDVLTFGDMPLRERMYAHLECPTSG